jgi:penicillin-binding protein 1A
MLGDYLLENLQALRNWAVRHRVGLVRIFAVTVAIVAIPVTLLYLTPSILELFAPKLDLSQDLYAVNRPIAFTFLDASGQDVGHRGAIVGERLTLDQMPAYLPAAFIAMEDRRFYSHNGIDIRGLVRATITNFHAGHVVAGGSTITQQTAKIVFLNPNRTFARKFEELMDAAALEKSLSKKEILELYLNRIYLGSGAYGVDGAAHVYFGKSARDVTLGEAAMLATLTRAPSVFSPRRDLASAQERAGRVLNAMVETGAISRIDADAARAHPAIVSDSSLTDARNFFLDTAADEATRLVGANAPSHATDLIVHTTLEPRLQEAARHAVARTLNARGAKVHASEAAVVLMKPDGAVSALIGGRDYDASVFNRATQAKRQPGSAFKPFVYLAAVENGISPWDVREDGPVDIDGWTPTNYGGRSYGTVTLADALAHSINTVTAGLAQEVGITTIVDAAHRCGIVSELAPNASLALGTSEVTPIELTTAYAAFASGGLRVWPYYVTEVDDRAGHVLYKREPPDPDRVIASHVDRDLVAMLNGVIVEGTGRGAALPGGRQAAGKTGTTQDYHDAWFVGFTTDYVAGVWVGNDDSSPMKTVTGGSLPAAIWKDVMISAEHGLPIKPLDMSPPQAPTDEDAATTDTSGTDNGFGPSTPGDDEAAPMQGAPPPPHSFWDWLTGGRPGNSGPPPGVTQREDSAVPQQPNPNIDPNVDPNADPNLPPPPRNQDQAPPDDPPQSPGRDNGN